MENEIKDDGLDGCASTKTEVDVVGSVVWMRVVFNGVTSYLSLIT